MTFFMRQKEGNVFKICHFLITGRVVLHNKFYKKISSTSYQKWKDYLGKKTSFWWLDLLFSGWKKMNIFSIDFNRKSEELSFNSKDNSLTFYATKRRERFFKICHFLITGRVVLHNKFYKKNFIYQLSKMEDYLGKKLLFGGWIYYSRGEKKWTFFRLISIEKVKNYLLIQKIILWHFMRQKEGNVFQNLSLFDNWSCSTTQEIL